MKTIRLHGKLAEKYGTHHKLDIRTPAEACAAMCARFPDFNADLVKHNWKLVTRRTARSKKGEAVIRPNLQFPIGRAKELHFIPTAQAAGIELIILGGFLLAAVGVIIGLSIPPVGQDPNAREEEKASFVFSGPVNQIEQGHPVPLVYGTMETGSIVASSSLESGDIRGTNGLPSDGGKFGSGSTGGFAQQSVNWLLEGGGKGGGSQRAAQEDPNTLQSESTARILDIISEGECEGPALPGLRWVKFNDTPLENDDGTYNFHGADIQTVLGHPTQHVVPGQNSAAVTTSVNVPVSIAGGAVIRTVTDPDTTRAKVTLEIPSLWRQDTENGDLLKSSVAVRIELQSAGGGFTTIYSGVGNDRANFVNQKTVAPYLRDFAINLPEGGAPWDIKVTRLTADGTAATISNDTNWKFLTEIVDAPLMYPYTAGVGLTVSARQFGTKIPKRSYIWKGLKISIPTNYDPITKVYATSGPGTSNGEWDGTFKTAWTDNPAWVFFDLCVNRRYGLGSTLSGHPNKWALYTIAKYCDQLVDDGLGGQEPRFTCNLVINKRTQALQVLRALSSSFRAMTFWNTQNLRVHQDAPEDAVQLLGPSNTVDGKIDYSTRSRSNDFSAWVVTWNDPSEGYKQNFEIVEDADLIRELGWKPSEVSAFGCSSRGQAARFGRWLRDDQQFSNEQMSCVVGADIIQHYPGQIVKVSDPLFTADRRTGRCGTGSTTTNIVLDGDVSAIGGTSINVTMSDGNVKSRAISSVNTTDGISTVTVAALPSSPKAGAIWVIETTTVAARQFRIMSISEVDVNEYQLTGLIHDPNKYARVEQNIDLEPPEYVGIPSGVLPPPATVLVKEFLREQGNSAVPALRVSWTGADDPRVSDYDCQYQLEDDAWEPINGPEPLSRELNNVVSGTYRFRVRSINALAQKGPWKQSVDFVLEGPTAILPDVTGLTYNRDNVALQTVLRWAIPIDVRPFRYRIYRNTTNDFTSAEYLGDTDVNEFTVSEEGFYWVETAFMATRSPSPPSIQIQASELPNPEWSRVDNRPTSLGDLDIAASAIIAANTQGVADLVTTYGTTASAAQSAASALASQTAAEAAESGAESYQILAAASEAASAASAASATLSDTSAGQHATAAQNSSTQAATDAAAASVSEGNAAVSETNAAGSASAAATSNEEVTASLAFVDFDFPTETGWTDVQVGANRPNMTFPIVDGKAIVTGNFKAAGAKKTYAPDRLYKIDLDIEYISGTAGDIVPQIVVYAVDAAGNFLTGSPPAFGVFAPFGSPRTHGTREVYTALLTGLDPAPAGSTQHPRFADAVGFQISGGHRSNDTSTVSHVYSLKIRDITESNLADLSATAAATNASNAAVSATDAGTFAAASSTSATNAATSESNASTFASQSSVSAGDVAASATTATNQATAAAGSAAASSTSAASADASAVVAEDIKNVTAKIANAALNENSTFADYSGGIPPQWLDLFGGTQSGNIGTRSQGLISDNCYDLTSPANSNRGIAVNITTRGWLVLSFDVVLQQGSYDGAGFRLRYTDELNVYLGDKKIKITEQEANGAVIGSGVIGERSSVSVLIDATNPAIDNIALWVAGHWSSLGDTTQENRIQFHRVSVRAATQMEIDAGRIVDIEATVAVNQSAIAINEGRLQAHWSVETSVPGADAFIRAQADLMPGGNAASTVAIGAEQFHVYNTANGSLIKALEVSGGNVKVYGDLEVGAQIFLSSGTGRWPLALQDAEYSLSDGDVTNFGIDIGDYDVEFSSLGLDPLAAGETYRLRAINKSGTGFTSELKIITPGGTTSITESTNATSPAGPQQMVAKANTDDAYNDIYSFYATGSISVFAIDEGGGIYSYLGIGFATTWFHDGSSWVEGPQITFSHSTVGIIPGHTSGTQTYSFTNKKIGQVNHTGTIRDSATLGTFGLDEGGDFTITNLNSVKFSTQTSSGTRTATPGAETSTTRVKPINLVS